MSIPPMMQAMEVYCHEPCARTFEQDLLLHHLHGYVFNTADYFVMGRPVERCAAPALIVNPAHTFPRARCDCWHIYLMAGSHLQAWEVFQRLVWLPWFSFERKNELRFYEASRMKRLSLGSAATP